MCEPESDKVFVWWLSFIFLLGILACCISGFVTANRLGFATYGFVCGYERIYYDILNGQLKTDYPKWEGTEKIKDYLTNLNNIREGINLTTSNFYFDKTELQSALTDCNYDFIYPVEATFADNVCKSTDEKEAKNYLEKVNKVLYPGVNSLFHLYEFNKFNEQISESSWSSDLSDVQKAMSSYNSKFIEDMDYYTDVALGIGKILPLIYFALLLTVVVGAGMLLIIYYCNCFTDTRQGFYLFPMHLTWNILRFFIFSFFMYGFGLGVIFLVGRDSIGYIQYIFGKENIGTSSTSTIILDDSAKKFFNYCLYSKNTFFQGVRKTNFNNAIANIILHESFKESNPTNPDSSYNYFNSYKTALINAVQTKGETILNYINIYKNTGDIFSGLNCEFIQNNLNLMYNALWDFSWEARILCTLSCFIAFMGALAVYGFLWSMFLWRRNDHDGYRFVGSGDSGENNNYYNPPNDKNKPLNTKLKSKKRKIRPPKNNFNNNSNNSSEMQEKNNIDDEYNDDE